MVSAETMELQCSYEYAIFCQLSPKFDQGLTLDYGQLGDLGGPLVGGGRGGGACQPRLAGTSSSSSSYQRATQVSLNNVARSIVGHKRGDHVTVPDLLTRANLGSLNSVTMSAVALEAGRTEYNNALEDYSLKRFEDDYKSSVDFLARSKDISPEESLSGQEKLNLRFLQAELETFASGFKFKGFLFPISYLEGVHIDFERLSEWMTLKTEKDFQDLVERYEKFPAQAQGIVEILEKAVKEQMVFHAISM
eukprot:maker-scaffold567_size135338-snap-gene-0.21 protein:Tk01952 transcript:maker-scaffold567_size135338-snap-gene-0.21-mRNA-1 annotation:"PREDICTED: uncharacterized protein LOC100370690 isoform X2"